MGWILSASIERLSGHPLRLLLSRPEGMISGAQLTAAALEASLSDRDGPRQKPEGIAIAAAASTD